MEKCWITYPKTLLNGYKTYDLAEEAAKRAVGNNQYSGHFEYGVYELVAVAKQPVPDVEIVKVK